MTDTINPDYYKDAPFECIELSRNYMSDWGQVIQYVWRHEKKNGIDDLRKALWFARDAMNNYIPLTPQRLERKSLAMLGWLRFQDYAHAAEVWNQISLGSGNGVIAELSGMIGDADDAE